MSGGSDSSNSPKPATKAAVGAGFFIVAATAFGLLTVAAVDVAIHPHGPGNGRGAGIAGAVLFFGFFGLFTHLALQAEHHWHWHRRGGESADPAVQLAAATATSAVPPPHQVTAVGKKHQRHGPVASSVIGIVLLGFTVFSFVFLFQSISGANRSNEVQKHGLRSSVTVVSIHHEQHSSRYSTWYTADITASLPDGSTTVVHDTDDDFDEPGTPLTVLIDPKNHNYAEFPGQPKGNSTNWIVALVFILVSGSVDVVVLRGAVRMIRAHRSMR